MPQIIVSKCPVPKCEHKSFQGSTLAEANALVKAHIIANLEDPNHSDIATLEGWLEVPDGLGD